MVVPALSLALSLQPTQVRSLSKSSSSAASRRDAAGVPPTLPGGPRVEHASGRCGTPEEGWRPVKSNPGPCKDSSVQCKVANKN